MHYNVYNNTCKNRMVMDMHPVLLGMNKMHQLLCA